MFDKKLVVIYYYSEDNKEIASSDHKQFYDELKDNEAFEKNGIIVDQNYCPNARTLRDKLKTLLEEPYNEIYLHFSGHGDTGGIPLGDWTVGTESFAIMLDHPKIKSCFFSSCKSAELVKVVTERDIPVVIGTREDKDIENSFAIEFQKQFYKGLADRKSFNRAFEDAWNDIEIDKRLKIDKYASTRGSFSLTKLQNSVLNKLQIVFSTKEEENRHLIYPTIVDRLQFIDDSESMVLIYGTDSDEVNKFIEYFDKKGYNENNIIIPLTEKDLTAIKSGNSDMLNMRSNVKIILLLTEEQPISKSFKFLFDKEKIFQYDNIKLRVVQLDGIDKTKILSSGSHILKDYDQNKFVYIDYDTLFKKDEFLNFLTGIDISDERRKFYTFEFPCYESDKNPVNVELEKISVQFFYISYTHEKVANFIINRIRYLEEKETPNLIINQHYHPDKNLDELLKDKIYKHLKLTKRRSLGSMIEDLLDKPYVIVLKLAADYEKEKVNESLMKIIDSFSKALGEFEEFNETPTYVFVFYHDTNHGDLPIKKEERFAVSEVPGPKNINTQIQEWNDSIFKSRVKLSHKKIIQQIFGVLNDSELENKYPTHAIEIICEGFKIPRKQILNIT